MKEKQYNILLCIPSSDAFVSTSFLKLIASNANWELYTHTLSLSLSLSLSLQHWWLCCAPLVLWLSLTYNGDDATVALVYGYKQTKTRRWNKSRVLWAPQILPKLVAPSCSTPPTYCGMPGIWTCQTSSDCSVENTSQKPTPIKKASLLLKQTETSQLPEPSQPSPW